LKPQLPPLFIVVAKKDGHIAICIIILSYGGIATSISLGSVEYIFAVSLLLTEQCEQ